MTLKRFTFLTLIALTVLTLGCSKTILVGALISQTGAGSTYGEKVQKGVELAVEEVNDAGGFKGKTFELVLRDDGTMPQMGIDATNELIDELSVHFIIGAVSSPVTLAVAPICEEKKVLLLSPTASAPDITSAGDYIFRNYPSDILEGTAMAEFARSELGLETLVVFAVDNAFGTGLDSVFEQRFVGRSKYRKVLKTYLFPEGDTSALPIAEELPEMNPDGIYVVGYVGDISEIIKSIRAAGVNSVILTASSITAGDLLPLAGTAAENTVIPQASMFDPHSDEPSVRHFIEAYRAKYGEEPDNFAAHGYDSVRLLLKAMEMNDSPHPSNVKLAMLHIKDFPGATGKITFDNSGDVVQYPRLFVIRQGTAVSYDQFVEEGGRLRDAS
jgi:branched-chain amino acid transport system substrate-binding protein